jgi:uncharacterized protein (DUF2141 family)
VLAAAALALLPGMVPAPDNSLEVHVGGLRSTKGIIRFCVTTEAKSFPDCKTGKVFTRSVPAATPHVRFDDLPAGDYAVAVIHDENGNAKLDTFMGIPREGFGFSRNPVIRFGPPSFKSTQFPVGGDAAVQQVTMKYML